MNVRKLDLGAQDNRSTLSEFKSIAQEVHEYLTQSNWVDMENRQVVGNFK